MNIFSMNIIIVFNVSGKPTALGQRTKVTAIEHINIVKSSTVQKS